MGKDESQEKRRRNVKEYRGSPKGEEGGRDAEREGARTVR